MMKKHKFKHNKLYFYKESVTHSEDDGMCIVRYRSSSTHPGGGYFINMQNIGNSDFIEKWNLSDEQEKDYTELSHLMKIMYGVKI